MSKKQITEGFRALVESDLLRATERSGRRAFFSALLWDPGFLTCYLYRLACHHRRLGRNRRARFFWRLNVLQSGCHLHFDSSAGPGLFLPHATGIALGSGCRLGEDVTLYQGVTIGQGGNGGQAGNRAAGSSAAPEDYPTIGNGVVIYANTTVAGPVTIGDGAVLGANSFVSRSVPPGAVAAGCPARVLEGDVSEKTVSAPSNAEAA